MASESETATLVLLPNFFFFPSLAKADVTIDNLSAFPDMRRCKNLGSSSLLKISNYLKACAVSYSQSTEGLTPDVSPASPSGGVEGQQLQ